MSLSTAVRSYSIGPLQTQMLGAGAGTSFSANARIISLSCCAYVPGNAWRSRLGGRNESLGPSSRGPTPLIRLYR